MITFTGFNPTQRQTASPVKFRGEALKEQSFPVSQVLNLLTDSYYFGDYDEPEDIVQFVTNTSDEDHWSLEEFRYLGSDGERTTELSKFSYLGEAKTRQVISKILAQNKKLAEVYEVIDHALSFEEGPDDVERDVSQEPDPAILKPLLKYARKKLGGSTITLQRDDRHRTIQTFKTRRDGTRQLLKKIEVPYDVTES